MRPSVILVREWEQQMSGSGCCGRISGDMLAFGQERVFPERRAVMERMGPLYRAIRRRYGERAIDLLVVDPCNQIVLLPRLIGDFRRFGVGWGAAFETLGRLATPSVIVNGRLVARGDWPDPAALLPLLDTLIGQDADRTERGLHEQR